MSKGKRSVTVSDTGDRVRARICGEDIEIAVGFSEWHTVLISIDKAKRLYAGLGEVIATAEALARSVFLVLATAMVVARLGVLS